MGCSGTSASNDGFYRILIYLKCKKTLPLPCEIYKRKPIAALRGELEVIPTRPTGIASGKATECNTTPRDPRLWLCRWVWDRWIRCTPTWGLQDHLCSRFTGLNGNAADFWSTFLSRYVAYVPDPGREAVSLERWIYCSCKLGKKRVESGWALW